MAKEIDLQSLSTKAEFDQAVAASSQLPPAHHLDSCPVKHGASVSCALPMACCVPDDFVPVVRKEWPAPTMEPLSRRVEVGQLSTLSDETKLMLAIRAEVPYHVRFEDRVLIYETLYPVGFSEDPTTGAIYVWHTRQDGKSYMQPV